MTAVLLNSRKVGAVGWVFLRGDNLSLHASGMKDGDELSILTHPSGGELSIVADGTYPLPVGVKRIKALHVFAVERDEGGVNLDVVRNNGHPNTG